jgi:hypothetical protein
MAERWWNMGKDDLYPFGLIQLMLQPLALTGGADSSAAQVSNMVAALYSIAKGYEARSLMKKMVVVGGGVVALEIGRERLPHLCTSLIVFVVSGNHVDRNTDSRQVLGERPEMHIAYNHYEVRLLRLFAGLQDLHAAHEALYM